MTHTYQITGMTCGDCESKVKSLLEKIEGIAEVKPDRSKNVVEVTMDKHIDTTTLKNALKDYPKYQLNETQAPLIPVLEQEAKSWIETYKPILLIFAFILGITILVEAGSPPFKWMRWMNHFMAGFFFVFSFFKLLNLRGFAESYAMYDVIAKQFKGYGYLYAFIELGLGIGYLTGFNPMITNTVTFLVMSISLVGVLQSVLNKRKIKCACLGDVFNLPMSTITIIEDGLMILMSLSMLLYFYI